MRTGQHHYPETLLAGMGTALAELVILAPAVLAQEERPFQMPFLTPAHELFRLGQRDVPVRDRIDIGGNICRRAP